MRISRVILLVSIALVCAGCAGTTGAVQYIKYTSDSTCIFWRPGTIGSLCKHSPECVIYHIPSGRTHFIPGDLLCDDPAACRWVIARGTWDPNPGKEPWLVVSIDSQGELQEAQLPSGQGLWAAFVPGTHRVAALVLDRGTDPNVWRRVWAEIGATTWQSAATQPDLANVPWPAHPPDRPEPATLDLQGNIARTASSYGYGFRGKNVRDLETFGGENERVEVVSPDGKTAVIVQEKTAGGSYHRHYDDCYVRLKRLDSGKTTTLFENTEQLSDFFISIMLVPIAAIVPHPAF